MRLSTFAPLAPLAFAGLMAVAGVAAAVSPASAAPAARSHLSDGAYLAAARCSGIAQGLGADASDLNKLLDDQDSGREASINDRAAAAREEAARVARRAGPEMKAHLTGEWEGVCKTFVG
jgi:hypothetical protein